MNSQAEITSEHVRQHLLSRAQAYSDRRNVKFSHISLEAVNDSKFLANVARGSNFTLRTYQRVIDWLDEREREEGAS